MMAQERAVILPPDGVYIQSIDGNFYTYDEWNLPNQKANGVAVISSEHPNGGFVIASTKNKSTILWMNVEKYVKVPGVTTVDDKSTAIKDYKGLDNSSAIVSKYGNTSDYAAGWCQNYIFRNGKHGYLGSCGEWTIACNNRSKISSCISLIRGDSIIEKDLQYWTSTQADSINVWGIYWDGYASYANKLGKCNVRAFCSLL